MSVLRCSECGYRNKTNRDKCPECGGDSWTNTPKKKKNRRKQKPKPRIPIAPPSRRHRSKKDYKRKKKWTEDEQ